MDSLALTRLAEEQIAAARSAASGRSARTLHGGRDRVLRQILMGLANGHGLGAHENPGEATLQVVAGRVRLSTDEHSWEGGTGDYVIIPPRQHALDAIEDSAVILTVVPAAGTR